MDQLYTELKKYGDLKINTSFSRLTTFDIGGPAQYLVRVADSKKLVDLLTYLNGEGVGYFIIGGGSNLLMPDNGLEGVTIKIQTTKIELVDHTIVAEAGVQLGALVNLASKNNLTGLEWAVGIPGTVGGAVRGNAGAMGLDISNTISKVEIWRDGEVLTLSSKDCGFNYRESFFKSNKDIILRAWFELQPGDKKEIMEKTQAYMKQRTGRFPRYPSAGSFFKNIKLDKWPGDIKELPELFQTRGAVPIGWIVEQLDLKGLTVGGAKISEEHGNFLVNFQEATQADILKLVEIMKEKAYNKFKVELEPEVEIIQ
ncbi:MAG: UDP-N-acetylmuramate dehydrogenase [Candidatus Magasanikbacteria bacterium]|jgi:UDP-N-acetylmuramate dehydrogenase